MRDPSPAAAVVPPASPRLKPPSRAEIERAVVRGRCLQGEALRSALRRLFRPRAADTGRTRRRQSCC